MRFIGFIGGLYTITFGTSIHKLTVFLKKIKGSKKAKIDKAGALKYNEILYFTAQVCNDEFLNFLSELQIAAYSSAARTLRYILELVVDACEFQTDERRSTFNDLINAIDEGNLEEFLLGSNAWSSFIERYRIYEKTKRVAPTFKELVNTLNSREIFREIPQINYELKKIYEMLSDHVHPSLSKIESQIAKKGLRVLTFDPKEFDTIFEIGLKTFDMTQFVIIKSITHYYNYKNANEFLKDISIHIRVDPKVAPNFLRLPYSKKLSEGIKWKIAHAKNK